MDIINPINYTVVESITIVMRLFANHTNHLHWIPLAFLLFLLAACQGFDPSPDPTISVDHTQAGLATSTTTPLPSVTWTVLPTSTSTATLTVTETPLPTSTPSPTITATSTSEYPQIRVLEQANCRYGPGKAYLYAHGLYEGDTGEVHGRNYSGTWLWIKPWNLDWHCWAAASVLEVSGNVKELNVVQTRLPKSTLYGPPEEIQAVRQGDIVQIAWSPVWMTEDDYRGYLIEATVCQNGSLIPIAIHIDGTQAEIVDEAGCNGESKSLLYTVEKHGYTDPVKIPWP